MAYSYILRERVTKAEHDYKYVIAACCAIFGVSKADLLSSKRDGHTVACRDACAYLMKKLGGSYPSIGKALGRDHSSMVHSVGKVLRFKELSRHTSLLDRLEREVEFRRQNSDWWMAE